MLDGMTVDEVEEEFRLFQATALEDEILAKQVDEAWKELGLIERGGTKLFAKLSKVMLGICVIFHSNADCERIFSLVVKNKTQYRASLSTEMLSSLVSRKVTISTNCSICYNENFSDSVLQKAKSATSNTLKNAKV